MKVYVLLNEDLAMYSPMCSLPRKMPRNTLMMHQDGLGLMNLISVELSSMNNDAVKI